MFRVFSCPSSGATTAAVAASGLQLHLGDSSNVGRGRAVRPDHDQQYCYHHAPKVKPEVATAVVGLLMMAVRTPGTWRTVSKCQYNKLEKLLHLVGNLFELYDDARTSKFQTLKLIGDLLDYHIFHILKIF
jgi:hypothetical protein